MVFGLTAALKQVYMYMEAGSPRVYQPQGFSMKLLFVYVCVYVCVFTHKHTLHVISGISPQVLSSFSFVPGPFSLAQNFVT